MSRETVINRREGFRELLKAFWGVDDSSSANQAETSDAKVEKEVASIAEFSNRQVKALERNYSGNISDKKPKEIVQKVKGTGKIDSDKDSRTKGEEADRERE